MKRSNLVRWRNQVECIHIGQWFPFFANILDNGNTFASNFVHLATWWYHSHSQLIDDQDLPFTFLMANANHIIHNLCLEYLKKIKTFLYHCTVLFTTYFVRPGVSKPWSTDDCESIKLVTTKRVLKLLKNWFWFLTANKHREKISVSKKPVWCCTDIHHTSHTHIHKHKQKRVAQMPSNDLSLIRA